jgi:hypothetical protein
VHDAGVVGRLERHRDLPRDGERLVERKRLARDANLERVAFHQFHDDGAAVVRLLDPVNSGGVRMIEGREHLGFALEPGEVGGVAGERVG